LQLLADQTSCVPGDIFAHLPLSRGSVNQHLTALKEAGWIETTLSGSQITYCLNNFALQKELVQLQGVIGNLLSTEFVGCSPDKNGETVTGKESILFLCTGNSCRSQMAEAFFNHYAKETPFEAASAGTVPADEIHPLAVRVMKERGLSLTDQYPKSTRELIAKQKSEKVSAAMVFFVCSEAEKDCPYLFPFARRTVKMPFEDPASFVGNETDRLEKFREIRDEIELKIEILVEELTMGIELD